MCFVVAVRGGGEQGEPLPGELLGWKHSWRGKIFGGAETFCPAAWEWEVAPVWFCHRDFVLCVFSFAIVALLVTSWSWNPKFTDTFAGCSSAFMSANSTSTNRHTKSVWCWLCSVQISRATTVLYAWAACPLRLLDACSVMKSFGLPQSL